MRAYLFYLLTVFVFFSMLASPSNALPYAYIGNANSIGVVDMATNNPMPDLSITGFTGTIGYIRVNPQGSFLFASDNSNKIYKVSLNNFTIRQSVSFPGGIYGLWVNNAGSKLYAVNSFGNVRVYNTADMSIRSQFDLPTYPASTQTQLQASKDGSYLYIPSGTVSTIYVIDTVSDSIGGYFNLGSPGMPYYLAMRPDGQEMACMATTGNRLLALNPYSGAVTKNVSVTYISRMVYDTNNSILYGVYRGTIGSTTPVYKLYASNFSGAGSYTVYPGGQNQMEISFYDGPGGKKILSSLSSLGQHIFTNAVNGTNVYTYSKSVNSFGVDIATVPVLNADFAMDRDFGTPPFAVHFQDISGGYPVSWDWDFGDGSAHSTYANPSHTYSTSGNFTVGLTVYDSLGNHATQYQTVWSGATSAPPDFGGWNISVGNISINFDGLISAIETFIQWEFDPWKQILSDTENYTSWLVTGQSETNSNISALNQSTGNWFTDLENKFIAWFVAITTGQNYTTANISALNQSQGNWFTDLENKFIDWYIRMTTGMNNTTWQVQNAASIAHNDSMEIYDFLTNTSDYNDSEVESTTYAPFTNSMNFLNNSISDKLSMFGSPVSNYSTSVNSSFGYLSVSNSNFSNSSSIAASLSVKSAYPPQFVWGGTVIIWLVILGYIIRGKS